MVVGSNPTKRAIETRIDGLVWAMQTICDYCGEKIVASGSRARHTIAPLLWCGECEQGIDSIFGSLTDDQLRSIVKQAQNVIEAFGTSENLKAEIKNKEEDRKDSSRLIKLCWDVAKMEDNRDYALKVLNSRHSS